ncbi:4-hydroxy-3-methylbut-2-enyl diphosphate reductase [Raoultibacter massiliensis]|uniref:4-hydroxy-3-methylbut-2-enyl diphosphate reductase n=1 Tax=Raoultibacter massiliensis TaxID=1852371 RepID=A0ABV1JB75_9ACTN
MKVLKARHAGACYGVQRALDMAYAAICDGSTAYTLGPLIHNPQVVSKLEKRGVGVASSLDEVSDGIVIIRSHGVVPQVKQDAEAKGLPIIDATCPHVARAQKAASGLADEGYHVIAVGEAGHPEVEGMKAHAEVSGGTCIVVAGPEELPEHIEEPVGIVVQTTQSKEALDAVVEALHARGIEPQVKNTICFATRQRQEAAAELAEQVDALVVIGGRNSSNTTRLYDICKAICPRSHHVETPDEIDPAWFEGCAVIGVTAGASTPEDQIDSVVERLESL